MLTRWLLEHHGTRKTLGVLTGITSGLGITVSLAAQRPRRCAKRQATKMLHWETLKEPKFALLMAANLIHPLTFTTPMMFGPEFSHSLGFTATVASRLLATNSVVGIPGRLGFGALGDRLGQQNMLMLGMAVYTLSSWTVWLSADQTGNKACWITFIVFHGLVNGSYLTMINPVLKGLFGPERYYPINGAFSSVRGLG